jgi:hypothetical protein
MSMTGYRYRVVRERVNQEFRPTDFVSRTRLREGQTIAIDRESWIIRKIDPEGAGPNYDGFVWAVEPEPPGASGG